MAARNTKSEGKKPDKILRNALLVAVNREDNYDGKTVKRMNIIADRLSKMAAGGDIQAIKEVWDRLEGKASQAVEFTDPDGNNPFAPLLTLVSDNGRPNPKEGN